MVPGLVLVSDPGLVAGIGPVLARFCVGVSVRVSVRVSARVRVRVRVSVSVRVRVRARVRVRGLRNKIRL